MRRGSLSVLGNSRDEGGRAGLRDEPQYGGTVMRGSRDVGEP